MPELTVCSAAPSGQKLVLVALDVLLDIQA